MTHPDGRSASDPNIDHLEPPSPWFVWSSAFVLFTVTGFFRFTYKYFEDVANNESGTFVYRLIDEVTGTYAAAVLFVLVVAFVWRYPLDRPGARRRVPLHIVAMVAYSVVHTSILWASRTLIFRLAGMGAYDYGDMPVRYLMEFGEDGTAYASFVAVITLYRYYRTTRQRELRTANLERGLAQAELRNLRLQLQPHFLFNALNTISSTMYDDPRSADRMIGQLSQLLRLSLHTSQAQEVPLREELEVLSCYLGLMHARFGARLRAHVSAPAELHDVLVPSMLLQPLVENAIRHGHASQASGGTVTVEIARQDDRLHISVADDGPGAPAGSDVFGRGIGLSATRERVRLLYGAGGTCEAGNRPGGGFAVQITIPMRHPALPAESGTADVADLRDDSESVAFMTGNR